MASRMTPPEHAHEFLASCGWGGARIEPLAGDASFRRYFRVIADGRKFQVKNKNTNKAELRRTYKYAITVVNRATNQTVTLDPTIVNME